MNTEQKMTAALGGLVNIQRHIVGLQEPGESLGAYVSEHKNMQDLLTGKANAARIPLSPLQVKTAILSTSTQNDPLVNPYRPAIAEGASRRLFVRDLLLQGTTDQGAIE